MDGREKKHRHGGRAEFDLERLDLSARPVLDFSVNLNPLGPPGIIRERWPDLLEGIESYPSLEGDGVARYYQEKFDISPGHFMAGNGSTEVIYQLPRVLRLNRVAIAVPSYHDYWRACTLAGTEVLLYPLLPERNFSPDRDSLIKILNQADALWLGNPNNPTGGLFPEELIRELAETNPEKWIIIDEAFMPFVEGRERPSGTGAPARKNILVIHSLTKFYALAGLRLGGIIGHETVISRLKEVKEPWTVNGLADRVAPLLLGCGDYETKSRSIVSEERRRLFRTFETVKDITPYPSSANFILCQWHSTDNLDDLLRHLLSSGIYVRDCRNFHGLEDNYFRTAVRSPAENDQLISAILSFKGSHG